jgi:ATP-dependent helicase/DNAse subunit B
MKMRLMAVNSIEDIDDPLMELTLTPLSYSRLDTYEQCAARYFYSYVMLEPRTFAIHAVLGNIIHSALENTLEVDVKVADIADDIISEYKKQISEWDPEGQITEPMLEAGEVMLNEFIDRHGHESFPIVEKEMGFSVVVGNYLVSGYIDRVDIVDDIVYLIDYKSGKNEVSFKNVADNLQLGIYAMAVKNKYPDKQVHGSLYYLRSGRIKSHLYTDEEIEAVEGKIIARAQELLEDNTFRPTTNTRFCGWCDHAKSGICSVGVRARNQLPANRRN